MPRTPFRKPRPVFSEAELTASALPDSPIDCAALTAHLASLGDDRAAALTILKSTLQNALEQVQGAFTQARLGGLETARHICAVHDDLVRAIWTYATEQLHPNPNPTPSEIISLCAVGGYGRGEMAPFSDLDLLFLTSDKKTGAYVEKVTECILYFLWDLGLKVGHAVRTPDQCVALAKTDQTILTSLLDTRYLAGDPALTGDLIHRFRAFVMKSSNRSYIADKLAERDARHSAQGNSRYQIEPNIKEGKGGLRDLHVLYWIATFLDNLDGEVEDANSGERYVKLGLFDETAAQRFERASDFLWRARLNLHYTAGRAHEKLSFDYQVKLAPLMGHRVEHVEIAVERFMREYFLNAREVGALTRIACARLEAQNAIRLPAGLDALLPNSKKNMRNKSFILDHGRLMFRDPLTIKDRPAQIMELFEIAGRRNLDIHPDALQAIDYRRNLIDTDFRRDPNISKIFQKILLGAKVPGATLKIMNEAGVLGRYLLEFGGIVARTQFNMFHAYTVDEHTLQLVTHYNDIEEGIFAREHPVSTEVAKHQTDEERLTLYLACLLHDTGKGQGDQCIEGAKLARRACRRLGMSQKITDDVAWLVRRHLDMSETAQRRDLSDPDTIRRFSDLVGTESRLDLLTLLTVVDIRSVGPGVWNDWKGTLLRELYVGAKAELDGREDLPPSARAASLREQLLERLPGDMAARIGDRIRDLPDNYWARGDMEDFLRHARFFDQAVEASQSTRVGSRIDRARDITELWVLTRDREGLFADLTLAIAASAAQVKGAHLSTSATGQVFNIFYIQNADSLAFGRDSAARLAKLRESATAAAMGQTDTLHSPGVMYSRRAKAIPIRPAVRVLEDLGQGCIIEIEGRDRPGLLHALARVLHAHELPVQSAHIEVAGPQVFDVFYVGACPMPGGGLEADLLRALEPRKVEAA
jgi:[protein-PII] uridylyltransferase